MRLVLKNGELVSEKIYTYMFFFKISNISHKMKGCFCLLASKT